MKGFVPWPDDFVRLYKQKGYWEDKTLAEHFDEWVARYSDKPAVISGDGEVSFKQLDEYATRLAYGMAKLGIKTYDPVIIQLFNCPELIYFFYACMKIGAVAVCALPLHRQTETNHFAGITSAKAIVVPAGTVGGFDYERFAAGICRDSEDLDLIFTNGAPGHADMHDINTMIHAEVDMDEARAYLKGFRPDPMEPALLQLSGGTTGVPKLIPRTHNDYAYNARCCAEACFDDNQEQDSRALIAIPMMHNAPLVCGMLPSHLKGAAVIPTAPKTEAILRNIDKFKPDVLSLVPVFIHYLLDVPPEELRKYDLSSVQRLMWGGNAVNPKVQMKFRQVFQCDSDQVYGMAEGLICWTRPNDPLDVKITTQGRPVSEADEIKVADVNTGEALPDGHSGECWTRGPYTIRGYFKAEEQNKILFTNDGFYRTGDLVVRDARGNITVLGRVKDCISRGAEKVNAEEVEGHINQHPKVNISAVVGMPDKVYGERICAFVVPNSGKEITLEDLAAFLINERKIASFKVPERVEIIDDLPVSSVGKFEKKTLKKMIVEMLREEGAFIGQDTGAIRFASVDQVFEQMPELFNPEQAQDLRETFQFVITGTPNQYWVVDIDGANCRVAQQEHQAPTVTITLSDENWLDLVNGQTDGQSLLMNGQLKAEGNILAATLIKKLFAFD